MNRYMRSYRYLHPLTAIMAALLLMACADMNDATTAVSVTVQLTQPTDCRQPADLAGKSVTLQIGAQDITAKTDAEGRAVFSNIVPDVYNISTSWDISAEEYQALTGSDEVVSGGTISSSVNARLISSDETISLPTLLAANRDIVIGKIFYAGSRDNNNRSYMAGKYIELYNQSDHDIDVSGLYIGMTEAESTPAYTLDNLHTAFADTVVLLKQIYRIPTTEAHLVKPGGTVVICNSAIDHTTNNRNDHNLVAADFEVKDVTGKYQNNPAVAAMEMVYQIYNGTSVMNLLQSGPAGVVIFRTTADVTAWPKVYAYGKSTGNQWVLCPVRYIIDGVEALRNGSKGVDVKTKRLYDNIDAGYTYINAASGWNGETVYRKTLKRADDGHRILVDTNNSSNDFKTSTTIQPREYDE